VLESSAQGELGRTSFVVRALKDREVFPWNCGWPQLFR